VVPKEFDDSNCIDLVIARPDEHLVSAEFLSRYFNSGLARRQIREAKVGLAQQHLNVGAVKRMMVPVPPRAISMPSIPSCPH
jgi:type I restriction enzyme S subunit